MIEIKGIKDKTDGIKIFGHIGTWYIIDETHHNGAKIFLLESEQFGDEANCIIVDRNGTVVLDDVWNGFGDLDLL